MIHADSRFNRIQDPDNKIPQDEPAFLLLARDPIAVEAVAFWLKRNRVELAKAKKGKTSTPEQLAKRQKAIDLVAAHIHRMADWPTRHPADA